MEERVIARKEIIYDSGRVNIINKPLDKTTPASRGVMYIDFIIRYFMQNEEDKLIKDLRQKYR